MRTFEFTINEKVTIWREHTVLIDAPTQEEAILLAKDIDLRDSVDSELDYESEEQMTPEENEGVFTKYITNDKDEVIWKNG